MTTPAIPRALLTTFALLLLAGPAQATEGMWMPEQLTGIAERLTQAGLKLPPKTLQDLDKGPLSAVINLSGCTASFISEGGLIVTNHHCAVGAIQRNSTPKDNLLEAGFTAKSQANERWAGPSARVRITVEQLDVTPKFRAALKGVSDDLKAFEAVDATKKALVKSCEKPPGYRCRVATYDGGARYVQIKQLDLRDVRLVHAPPRAIGVFGGDVDNWMWPRHTGDWSLFRAYVGKDGKPADHAKGNVPYRPKRWLRVNPKGVRHGDYVMVAGYPGRTYRYRLPLELAHAERVGVPRTIRMVGDLVAILESEQRKDPAAKVKLTSLRAGLANYLKYSRGLLDGVRKSGATAAQEQRYAALKAWIAKDPKRKAELGAPLDRLEARLRTMQGQERRARVLGWMLRLPVLMRTASTLHWLSVERLKPDAKRDRGYQERDWNRLRGRIEHRARSYVPAADKRLLAYLLREAARLPKEARIPQVDALLQATARLRTKAPSAADAEVVAKAGTGGLNVAVTAGHIRQVVEMLYARETLADAKRRAKLFEAKRKAFEAAGKTRKGDPMISFVTGLYGLRKLIDTQHKRDAGFLAAHRPVYMAALRARFGELYPDANSTLRVTYGHVRGYKPREAVEYAGRTTLRGIVEKDTGKAPFDVPKAQKAAIARTHAAIKEGKAKAPWVDAGLGTVPVNFLSTCDTTGGNSGSPTLDAQGRLVGLLFDGNYEAMASDWVFDRVLTRSIHVDVRYMLWALDALLGGKGLLREMGL